MSTDVHLGECEPLRCIRLKHLGLLLLAQVSGGMRGHLHYLIVGEVFLRGCHLRRDLDRVRSHVPNAGFRRSWQILQDDRRLQRRRGTCGRGVIETSQLFYIQARGVDTFGVFFITSEGKLGEF